MVSFVMEENTKTRNTKEMKLLYIISALLLKIQPTRLCFLGTLAGISNHLPGVLLISSG